MTESRESPESPETSEARAGSSRTRSVIVLTSVLAVLVMAGVVALGLHARRGVQADGGTRFGDRSAWGNTYRDVPWDDERCEPDRAHPPHLALDLPPQGLVFGPVKQGVELERSITFRNDGTGALCIRDVDSGCGCIKAELEGKERVFEPGESGSILIRLDTEGREGSVRKTIAVYTNSLEEPRRTFDVRASISVGLIATPLYANFPRALAGQPSTMTVRLRSADTDEAWKVLGVEGRVKVEGETVPYTFEVRPMDDPKHRIVDVEVTQPGREIEGPFQDTVVIRTDHPDRPEVVVRTHLMVVPPVIASPPRVSLGYVPSERKIRVRLLPGADGVSFRVEGVRFETLAGEPPTRGSLGFAADWEEGPDGQWFVDVRYDGRQRPAGRIEAMMVVETDREDLPELDLEVSATVQ